MNICVVTSSFPSDKTDLIQAPFIIDIIKTLEFYGHNIYILTQQKQDFYEPIKDSNVTWFFWKKFPGSLAEARFDSPKKIISLLSLFYNGTMACKRMAKQHKIDIFLCLWVVPNGLYLYLNKFFRLMKIPYLVWALGSDINNLKNNMITRYILKRIIKNADAAFADGFVLCEDVKKISGKYCEFLPTFRKLHAPSDIKIKKTENKISPPTFLFVGRHSMVKGIDILINSILQLEENFNYDYRFHIAGDGSLFDLIRKQVDSSGLGKKIILHGRVSNEKLIQLYAESDCVVIPSRKESIPVVFSEALQMDKAMIVTDVGDMGNLGREYGVAKVIPPENIDALAEAIRDFIAAPFEPDKKNVKRLLDILIFDNSVQKLLSSLDKHGKFKGSYIC